MRWARWSLSRASGSRQRGPIFCGSGLPVPGTSNDRKAPAALPGRMQPNRAAHGRPCRYGPRAAPLGRLVASESAPARACATTKLRGVSSAVAGDHTVRSGLHWMQRTHAAQRTMDPYQSSDSVSTPSQKSPRACAPVAGVRPCTHGGIGSCNDPVDSVVHAQNFVSSSSSAFACSETCMPQCPGDPGCP